MTPIILQCTTCLKTGKKYLFVKSRNDSALICKLCHKKDISLRKEKAKTLGISFAAYNQRLYALKNKDAIAARSVARAKKRAADKDKATLDVFRQYVNSAKQRGIPFQITLDEFKVIKKMCCCYCGEYGPKIGIDRYDSSQPYSVENSFPCCTMCNYMKMDLTENEFFEKLFKIAFHRKLKL